MQDPNTSFHFKADLVSTFHSDADPDPASCQRDAKLRPLYIATHTLYDYILSLNVLIVSVHATIVIDRGPTCIHFQPLHT